MIIYGSKSKELAKETLEGKCPNCGTQNRIDMYVFQKYSHVFWIPFFPMGKTGISQCDHCKEVLKLKEMPSSLTTSYEDLKKQTKTPAWMFSGLALVAVLISFGVISEKKKDEKNARLVLTPQSGDIYEIKTTANQFTLYKVDLVRDDSVYVRVNNYETNLSSGIADLKSKGDTAYSEEVVSMSRAELKEMLGEGAILNIDRK